MINVLFSARPQLWDVYHDLLIEACAAKGIEIKLGTDIPAEQVDYIIFAPNPSLTDFTPFTRCKAVLSLWAGVESIAPNTTLTQPLCRLVDTGLTQGMVEWVTGHVLRHHLGMDQQIKNQNGKWAPIAPPLSKDRPVTILGLGELGAACAKALVQLGFPVTGWSRTPKSIDGVRCLSGSPIEALKDAQIAVLLLPLTSQTENTLNADALNAMANGAYVINPGRGALIDDDALLEALNSGQIAHATLDVFRVEPLPADHPYWAHPNVTVTPHIASETRPETAVEQIAENLRRAETGEPLLNLVDRTRGY